MSYERGTRVQGYLAHTRQNCKPVLDCSAHKICTRVDTNLQLVKDTGKESFVGVSMAEQGVWIKRQTIDSFDMGKPRFEPKTKTLTGKHEYMGSSKDDGTEARRSEMQRANRFVCYWDFINQTNF